MAAGVLQMPGSEFGPCVEQCKHVDCAATRDQSETLCTICNTAIGYQRAFYNAPSEIPGQLVHATCMHAGLP